MAKPIPVNRRHLENQAQGMTPTPPARPRDVLARLVVLLRENPEPDENFLDDFDLEDPFDETESAAVGYDDEDDFQMHEPEWADEDEYEDDDEILDAEELVSAYAALNESVPVITARYAGTCQVCGNPIQVGDRITRHAQTGVWVHQGCRHGQARAILRSIVARYDGYCRLCRQPFPAGESIVYLRGYGWVQAACARQHLQQED